MAFPLALLGFIPNLISYYQKKQEMQLRWWELIYSVVKDLLTFIIAHIRIILIGLVLAYCLFQYLSAVHYGKSENKLKIVAQKALSDRVKADKEAAQKREAENRLKEILAQKKTDVETAKHDDALATIARLSKLNKGLKNETTINRRDIANFRDGLSLAIRREEDRATTRMLGNDTDRLTERDGDTAISRPVHEVEAELEVCKEAGALAAADYNFCKSYVDIQQSKLGVTK